MGHQIIGFLLPKPWFQSKSGKIMKRSEKVIYEKNVSFSKILI